jgi:hypothetical protein
MTSDTTRLLGLTREMADAFARDDLEACAALLAERGALLADLRERCGVADGAAWPAELRPDLAEVLVLDRELQAGLAEAMQSLGRRLVELQARKTRHTGGGDAPLCLDRKV